VRGRHGFRDGDDWSALEVSSSAKISVDKNALVRGSLR
jgi:hypothetical protein